MINIRQSVFETNSSSMHSLSIIGSDRINKGITSDTIVEYGEFGWGYDTLDTPIEKISYLITQYQNQEDMIDMIKRAFKNYTGFELIIRESSDNWYPKGYIDHESLGMICEYITDENSIVDIVFNDKYTIVIDNDNH